MKTTTFAVIGGDQRSILCAKFLAETGAEVRTFGFDRDILCDIHIPCSLTLADAVYGADYILLPLPATLEQGHINTPLYHGTITCNAFTESLIPGQVVFAGNPGEPFAIKLKEKGILCHNYAAREEFAILNAIPTAEGTLEIAMHELPITLSGANCLVIGFGRIAKILCSSLSALGAHVSAAARRQSDRTWMQVMGYAPIHTKDLKEHINRFQLIINTAPARLMDQDVLKHIMKDALIIDLASRPGGVDFESAQKLGLKTVWALSLPGKVAPKTAADIICKTVFNIINDSEVKA